MAIKREVKEEFVRLRELDGVTFEECAKQLDVALSTAKRWSTEPWYEEIARTVRLARDSAIEEAARSAAKEQSKDLVQTETEWQTARRGFISRVRKTCEDTVQGLENIAEQIRDPNGFEDMRDYKAAVDAHAKLTDSARKTLMVEHEERLAEAAASAAANQRLTVEEISALTESQMRFLIKEGVEKIRNADGQVIEAEALPG